MYTITDENDQIGLDAVIKNKMIIGIIDKNNNRSCIMQTHNRNEVYKRYELGRYVILPFINGNKMNNEDAENLKSHIEISNLSDIVSFNSTEGLKPVKAFNNWKEAYEWVLGEEK